MTPFERIRFAGDGAALDPRLMGVPLTLHSRSLPTSRHVPSASWHEYFNCSQREGKSRQGFDGTYYDILSRLLREGGIVIDGAQTFAEQAVRLKQGILIMLGQPEVAAAELVELFFGQMLDADQLIAGILAGID